ncbi:MAG: tripartite tricarboxylate transporter substrate binding protein [Betaproteobacteria bacterium]|nr:tripartite tricarboxylate transporter substrate binding protein [Betaproteobacteria bacterium]
MKTVSPIRRVLLVALASLAAVPSAYAQSPFPTRSVTIVVPFPPGGGTDVGARIVAQKLSEKWGQPVVIENKGGAAGQIGSELVSKAKPDGYTLLMGNVGTQSVNPSLYPNMTYNPDTAFVPVSMVAWLPLVMLAHPSMPAKTPKEVAASARAKPGTLSYSSSGAGGSMHLAGALFESMAEAPMLHVPYKGGGPALQDLIAGHVNYSFATILEASGFVQAGKVRALAVTSAKRSPALPDVPTLVEAGYPGYEASSWIGLLAPAGTPAVVVEKVAADVREAVARPDVRDRFIAQGATPDAEGPSHFKAVIDGDRVRWAKIIREKNITTK